jgi:hypothetical protein
MALDVLIRYMDIITADSRAEVKRTGKNDRYVREHFFAAFLVAAPKRGSKRASRKRKEKSLAESEERAIKALAGRITM